MGPGAGSTETEVPLQRVYRNGGNEDPETGGESETPRNSRKCDGYKKRTVVLVATLTAAVFFGLLIAVIVPAVLASKLPSADLCPCAGPCCPDGWIGYRGKYYYFSETEGNWTYSQSHCSAFNASLAGIDSEQEMDFMLRYRGRFDHWIGLRRDPGQPWKWANGSEFNNTFVIRGDGDCAYLNDENGVSSLRCTSERHWICTKPDAFTQEKEDVVEGG